MMTLQGYTVFTRPHKIHNNYTVTFGRDAHSQNQIKRIEMLLVSRKEDREYNVKLKKIEDQFDEEVWKAESKRSQALLEAKEEKDQAS